MICHSWLAVLFPVVLLAEPSNLPDTSTLLQYPHQQQRVRLHQMIRKTNSTDALRPTVGYACTVMQSWKFPLYFAWFSTANFTNLSLQVDGSTPSLLEENALKEMLETGVKFPFFKKLSSANDFAKGANSDRIGDLVKVKKEWWKIAEEMGDVDRDYIDPETKADLLDYFKEMDPPEDEEVEQFEEMYSKVVREDFKAEILGWDQFKDTLEDRQNLLVAGKISKFKDEQGKVVEILDDYIKKPCKNPFLLSVGKGLSQACNSEYYEIDFEMEVQAAEEAEQAELERAFKATESEFNTVVRAETMEAPTAAASAEEYAAEMAAEAETFEESLALVWSPAGLIMAATQLAEMIVTIWQHYHPDPYSNCPDVSVIKATPAPIRWQVWDAFWNGTNSGCTSGCDGADGGQRYKDCGTDYPCCPARYQKPQLWQVLGSPLNLRWPQWDAVKKESGFDLELTGPTFGEGGLCPTREQILSTPPNKWAVIASDTCGTCDLTREAKINQLCEGIGSICAQAYLSHDLLEECYECKRKIARCYKKPGQRDSDIYNDKSMPPCCVKNMEGLVPKYVKPITYRCPSKDIVLMLNKSDRWKVWDQPGCPDENVGGCKLDCRDQEVPCCVKRISTSTPTAVWSTQCPDWTTLMQVPTSERWERFAEPSEPCELSHGLCPMPSRYCSTSPSDDKVPCCTRQLNAPEQMLCPSADLVKSTSRTSFASVQDWAMNVSDCAGYKNNACPMPKKGFGPTPIPIRGIQMCDYRLPCCVRSMNSTEAYTCPSREEVLSTPKAVRRAVWSMGGQITHLNKSGTQDPAFCIRVGGCPMDDCDFFDPLSEVPCCTVRKNVVMTGGFKRTTTTSTMTAKIGTAHV
eukprot:TRINITY_DN15049_c0_g1_i2.p1 TRINITY_DN15049_c0_g1~~TRINITY_DN15049_c0_g1_i2.p1  ORF type:complete len:861 (-),score=97.98 TRINITY_DN15049_c0_g1_i2:49-2631(-)